MGTVWLLLTPRIALISIRAGRQMRKDGSSSNRFVFVTVAFDASRRGRHGIGMTSDQQRLGTGRTAI